MYDTIEYGLMTQISWMLKRLIMSWGCFQILWMEMVKKLWGRMSKAFNYGSIQTFSFVNCLILGTSPFAFCSKNYSKPRSWLFIWLKCFRFRFFHSFFSIMQHENLRKRNFQVSIVLMVFLFHLIGPLNQIIERRKINIYLERFLLLYILWILWEFRSNLREKINQYYWPNWGL